MVVGTERICNSLSENQAKPFIYSPVGLDLKSKGGILAKYEPQARWLLNCIHYVRVTRNLDVDEYVNLNTDLLAKVMGRRNTVSVVRGACLDAGLIEIDNHYIKGEKSLGHRLGPVLQDRQWHRHEIKGAVFAKQVERYKTHIRSKDSLTEDVHLYLSNWANQVGWTEDMPTVLESVSKVKPVARGQVDIINDGMMHYSVCQYGRFHSNYTGLVSELRSCLQINGEKLREIDVVSSQPYHLACLLMDEGKSQTRPKDKIHLNPDLVTQITQNAKNPKKTINQNQLNSLSPPPLPYEYLFSGREDLGSFVSDVLTGNLYERIQQAGGFETRSQAKEHFFHAVYGNHGLNLKTIGLLYPSVAKSILALKKAKGYKWLPCEMQRRESKVMIGRACRRLMADYSHIPIVTVHDSILTTAEHLETVKEIILQAHAANVIQPKLRIK